MEKSSKAEDIYNYIRDQILSGRWEPGDKIDDLAISEETAVSRISVREALFRLTETGIVEKTYWKGYFIKEPDATFIENIIDTRILLENEAIKNFKKVCTAKQLNEMDNILIQSKELIEARDFLNYLKVDFSFHEAIYQGQPNYIISNIMNNYMLAIHMIRYISMGKDDNFISTAELSISEHHKILDCIKYGTVEDACNALYSHLSNHKEKSMKELVAKSSEN